jgi:hypothetical protein
MNLRLLLLGLALGLPACFAPAQDPAPAPVTTSGTSSARPANSGSSGPAATPVPASPTAPAAKPVPKPRIMPKQWGDRSGPAYVGHRTITERHAAWGWVWLERDNYRKARWVMLEEEAGVRVAPSRFLDRYDGDADYEYKFYGEFAPYKGYDPNYDLFVEVFRIKGFEVIGEAKPLALKPPQPSGKKRGSPFSRSRGVDYDY